MVREAYFPTHFQDHQTQEQCPQCLDWCSAPTGCTARQTANDSPHLALSRASPEQEGPPRGVRETRPQLSPSVLGR